jgi:hypothetical protein
MFSQVTVPGQPVERRVEREDASVGFLDQWPADSS